MRFDEDLKIACLRGLKAAHGQVTEADEFVAEEILRWVKPAIEERLVAKLLGSYRESTDN